MQRGVVACLAQRETCIMQRAACNVQRATCNAPNHKWRYGLCHQTAGNKRRNDSRCQWHPARATATTLAPLDAHSHTHQHTHCHLRLFSLENLLAFGWRHNWQFGCSLCVEHVNLYGNSMRLTGFSFFRLPWQQQVAGAVAASRLRWIYSSVATAFLNWTCHVLRRRQQAAGSSTDASID